MIIAGQCEEIKITDLTIDNYQEELLECEVPVVIYFWAAWCKPCKIMSTTINWLAIFHEGKVKFVEINADYNRKLLNIFRPLRGLPLLIFYKGGKEFDRILGLVPFSVINKKIMLLLEFDIDKK
jgi:thioredoxin 1